MQRRMYRSARGCCFETHWAAASAIEDYEVEDRKVHVVGIGPNHMVPPTGREWYPPRFLFVGKDWQRKTGMRLCVLSDGYGRSILTPDLTSWDRCLR